MEINMVEEDLTLAQGYLMLDNIIIILRMDLEK